VHGSSSIIKLMKCTKLLLRISPYAFGLLHLQWMSSFRVQDGFVFIGLCVYIIDVYTEGISLYPSDIFTPVAFPVICFYYGRDMCLFLFECHYYIYHRLICSQQSFSEISCVLLLVSSFRSTYRPVFIDVYCTSDSHCFTEFSVILVLVLSI